ncbi:MAG: high-potential iron-sulfur protein [Steroidobacteraceae bacterium]
MNRRELLVHALTSASIIAASASQAASQKLDPNDPVAKNVGYVEDAARVDVKKYPTFNKSQSCANCTLVQQRYGPIRPCSLFPGKMITAKGWCNAWSLRSFGK